MQPFMRFSAIKIADYRRAWAFFEKKYNME